MSETVTCPDCGAANPAGSPACGICNFPLGPPAASPREAAPPRGTGTSPAPIPRPLPRRPRRPPRAPGSGQALSVWLFAGGFAALLLVYMGIQANVERAGQPVEGSNEAQQQRADELMAELERDSTNVEARQRLADIYYDTGNWSEAASHYRRVVARDSSRVTAIVDLGVCYYNLGDPISAEGLFRLALRHDPHHPIALFNLGIVHEGRDEYEEALRYFHAALQSDPPQNMNGSLMQAIQRIQEKTGRKAAPLRP